MKFIREIANGIYDIFFCSMKKQNTLIENKREELFSSRSDLLTYSHVFTRCDVKTEYPIGASKKKNAKILFENEC